MFPGLTWCKCCLCSGGRVDSHFSWGRKQTPRAQSPLESCKLKFSFRLCSAKGPTARRGTSVFSQGYFSWARCIPHLSWPDAESNSSVPWLGRALCSLCSHPKAELVLLREMVANYIRKPGWVCHRIEQGFVCLAWSDRLWASFSSVIGKLSEILFNICNQKSRGWQDGSVGEAACCHSWKPKLDSWDSDGGRREPTYTSHLLTSSCVCTRMLVHTHTQSANKIQQLSN